MTHFVKKQFFESLSPDVFSLRCERLVTMSQKTFTSEMYGSAYDFMNE